MTFFAYVQLISYLNVLLKWAECVWWRDTWWDPCEFFLSKEKNCNCVHISLGPSVCNCILAEIVFFPQSFIRTCLWAGNSTWTRGPQGAPPGTHSPSKQTWYWWAGPQEAKNRDGCKKSLKPVVGTMCRTEAYLHKMTDDTCKVRKARQRGPSDQVQDLSNPLSKVKNIKRFVSLNTWVYLQMKIERYDQHPHNSN